MHTPYEPYCFEGVNGWLAGDPCTVAALHPIAGCAVATREMIQQDGWEDAYCGDKYFIKAVAHSSRCPS